MSKSHLLKYLLISPNLPVGGFCYSEGMESYLQNKKLKDPNSVKELIISELEIGQIRLDGKLLLDFFDIFKDINDGKNLKIVLLTFPKLALLLKKFKKQLPSHEVLIINCFL